MVLDRDHRSEFRFFRFYYFRQGGNESRGFALLPSCLADASSVLDRHHLRGAPSCWLSADALACLNQSSAS